MNTQIDWSTVGDVIGNHLPALWVAAAAVAGGFALNTLIPSTPDSAPEIAPGVAAVTPEAVREFPLEIGTVTRIVDGDTFDVQLDRTGSTVRVRLAWVDAPETDQPFGSQATEWAETTLLGRQVVLTAQDVDTYGRMVAQLTVKGDGHMWDTAATLTRLGLGWVDPRASSDRDSLREDQELAAGERAGIWSEPNPVPPWEWRKKGGRTKRSVPVLLSQKATNL